MGQVVHTSRIVITREKGPTRKAMIEGFPEKEHAATLDHIVGAVGG
jgi:hypothetical protein